MILGIDIGAQGALALIDTEGALLKVEDMPVLCDGRLRRALLAIEGRACQQTQ